MKRVLIVFPTMWDRKQTQAISARLEDDYDLILAEPGDEECPWDLDIMAYIEELEGRYRGEIDGVFSSSDYPGATVAAALAGRLDLPGPPPEAVIQASHKYYSRIAQREAAPEATARFALVDPDADPPDAGDVGFPCFIKPVKGAFSVMTRKLGSQAELESFLVRPAVAEFRRDYLHMFNQLVAGLTEFEYDGHYFLAEEVLRGQQVTLEGFVQEGQVGILGVVDSVKQPETDSFTGFYYPSQLPAGVQDRMGQIAARVIGRIGLSDSLFNIEMIYDPNSDRVTIIEVNPRICGQFADLYARVDGTSSYEVALSVASGQRPQVERGSGSYRVSASVPLRIFEPSRVERAPEEDDVRAVEALYPGTLIWNECQSGQDLTDFESIEDGVSARYGVINLGGSDRDEISGRIEEVRGELGYRFKKLGPRPKPEAQ